MMRLDTPTRVHGNERGFTLVELLVGSVLITVILGSLAGLLTSGQGTFEAQQAKTELRQEARVAVDRIARETRIMGYRTRNVAEVLTQASATTLQFAADIDDGDVDPPCGAAFENAVNGGVERVTYRMSTGRLLRDVDCWDGAGWSVDSTAQILAANLPAAQTLFRYFDENGTEIVPGGGGLTAAERATVRSIAIAIDMLDTGRTQIIGEVHASQRLTTQVQLHNVR